MLNSAVSTTFRLPHWVKDSRSGALLTLPSAFILRNAGDSRMDRRIQVEMPSRTMDSRNGRRQPQVSNSSPVNWRQARITSSESNRPRVAVDWIQLV
ncbi:hypothetical protein PAERUG_P45_London_17_VIM_2_12_12_05251 [Pseudomonas aeruginosa]|nr:hypothetical protein PAERUG_E5_London_17_VIM_2_12_12_04670 [Pseudomonas aeruginosa]CRR75714.1 hypothetical protein PAERUG_P45_London_17_VIM_2_12_12_05251 [Pseudomonas aeruginosa]